jgi:hypothetical protein
MADKIYVGDIGTVIDLDCGVDITSATDQKIKVKKPDDTEEDWTASIQGTDTLRHVVTSGEFDQAGRYYFQAYIASPTWTGKGETVEKEVFAKFT